MTAATPEHAFRDPQSTEWQAWHLEQEHTRPLHYELWQWIDESKRTDRAPYPSRWRLVARVPSRMDAGAIVEALHALPARLSSYHAHFEVWYTGPGVAVGAEDDFPPGPSCTDVYTWPAIPRQPYPPRRQPGPYTVSR